MLTLTAKNQVRLGVKAEISLYQSGGVTLRGGAGGSSSGNGAIQVIRVHGKLLPPVQVLAALALTRDYHLRIMTSQGAAGDRAARAISLPVEADAAPGLEFMFVTDGAEGLRIQAPPNTAIRLSDGVVSGVSGYIETLLGNQWLTLYKLAPYVWTARQYSDGWQVSE